MFLMWPNIYCFQGEQVEQSSDNRCVLGELPAYLSLNRLLNGILSYSWCYFVQFRPISQKFNSCVTDRRMVRRRDGRTDRQTDGHTLLKRCENASKNSNFDSDFISARPLIRENADLDNCELLTLERRDNEESIIAAMDCKTPHE